METVDKQVIAIVEVWQSQSYWPLNGWGAPNKQLGSTPHFYVPVLQVSADILPDNISAPLDWAWTTQWMLDKSNAFGGHDSEGWYYGPSFDRLNEIIYQRTGAAMPSKTSVVRRRRWLRTMRCSAPEILEQIRQRIDKLVVFRKNLEFILREKEESLKSVQFYEENRAFVFDQSLNLATQGTVATFAVLKDLFFKLKRLYQFMSERAQVELEYSAQIEALGRKFSNSITEAAQNPLISQSTATATSTSTTSGIAGGKGKNQNTTVKTPANPSSSAMVPTTPSPPSTSTSTSTTVGTGASASLSSAMSLSSVGVTSPLVPGSTVRSSFQTISNLASSSAGALGVLSSPKPAPALTSSTTPAAHAGAGFVAADKGSAVSPDDMDLSSHGGVLSTMNPDEVDLMEGDMHGTEENYLHRDASAVLFNSLAAVHIASAERMKQFSGMMKHSAVTKLEHVLTEISSLLKQAKMTFRKNSDICQLCDAAARKSFESAVEALNAVIATSTAEMAAFSDELSALKGNIPTTSAFNTTALQYTVNGGPLSLMNNMSGSLGAGSTHGGSGGRRSSFISSSSAAATTAAAATAANGNANATASSAAHQATRTKHDVWLCVQRYRQVVRDSQEAMCVLITEHMDLELHMQILCNKVYSLFLSMGNAYHQEQTSLWEESLQLFGNLLGDTITRIEDMGRPFPILQSPFAKLQAAEVIAASNPSTPVKGGSSNGSAKMRSPTPSKGSRTPAEIQYDDFPTAMGVFSFVVLYRDPLPLCPSVCLSGTVLIAKGRDFAGIKGDVLPSAIWKTFYAVVTSDGYFHILGRGKSDLPDVSYCLKRCAVQSFATDPAAASTDYAKVVIGVKALLDTDTSVKNGALKGEDVYIRLKDEEECSKWYVALSEPLTGHIYVDSDIEEESRQAMLKSMAILRGETDKIDLSLNKYTDVLSPSTSTNTASVSGDGAHPVTAAQKYDAFKHRKFIYEDEEDLPDLLSPGLLAMGGAPLQQQSKQRSNSVDSDNLDFERTTNPLPEGTLTNSIEHEDGDEDDEDDEDCDGDEEEVLEEDAHEFGPEDAIPSQQQDGDDEDEQADAGADEDNSFVASTSSQEFNEDGSPLKTPLYHLAGGIKPRPQNNNLPRTSSGTSTSSASVPEVPSYKINSHTRYQKGGDSWIKKDSPGGAHIGAVPKTPGRSPKPKQLIPTSDVKQPLARRHSSMINQYETGLEEERRRGDNRVKETKLKTIQDVVSRVILEGGEVVVDGADSEALLTNPSVIAAGKKTLVKQMTVKFSAPGSSGAPAGPTTTSVSDYETGSSKEKDMEPAEDSV